VCSSDLALALYRTAADRGSGFARQQLGWAYFKGDGVKLDKTAAAKWWFMGAQASDSECLRLAAWTFANGVGTKKDFSKARRLLYPLYYKSKTNADKTKTWATRYRKATWVTSKELIKRIKSVRVQVTVTDNVLKYFSHAAMERAVVQAVKAKGFRLDPKSTGTLKVEISGYLKQGNALNRIMIVCKIILPAMVRRNDEFVAIDAIVRSYQQINQMPENPIALVNNITFGRHVRNVVMAAGVGEAARHSFLRV